MTTNRETVIQDLKDYASYDLVLDRGSRIAAARRENVTWREIAECRKMTEGGVHKAYTAYLKPKAAK